MGAGGLLACLGAIGVSAAAFYYLLQQERLKPACIWIWADANKSGAKTCLPLGATSVPFTPAYVITPKGLKLQMQLQNTDSSLTSLSVDSNSRAQLGNAISAGQSIKSVSVTAA